MDSDSDSDIDSDTDSDSGVKPKTAKNKDAQKAKFERDRFGTPLPFLHLWLISKLNAGSRKSVHNKVLCSSYFSSLFISTGIPTIDLNVDHDPGRYIGTAKKRKRRTGKSGVVRVDHLDGAIGKDGTFIEPVETRGGEPYDP